MELIFFTTLESNSLAQTIPEYSMENAPTTLLSNVSIWERNRLLAPFIEKMQSCIPAVERYSHIISKTEKRNSPGDNPPTPVRTHGLTRRLSKTDNRRIWSQCTHRENASLGDFLVLFLVKGATYA